MVTRALLLSGYDAFGASCLPEEDRSADSVRALSLTRSSPSWTVRVTDLERSHHRAEQAAGSVAGRYVCHREVDAADTTPDFHVDVNGSQVP